MAERELVWLSRDRTHGDYELWSSKPVMQPSGQWTWADESTPRSDLLFDVDGEIFARITGYELEPGMCVQVQITVEEAGAKP